MRIAQVSPLHESVPPQGDGGPERLVAHLADELVRRGHQVTLFASGDSRTRAELVSVRPRALRRTPEVRDPVVPHVHMLDLVARRASGFDLIHFHLDALHLPLLRWLPVPHLTTLHGRLDPPEVVALWSRFRDVPVASVSDAQRAPLPTLGWRGTVRPGLPVDRHTFRPQAGAYLALAGPITPEPGPERAVEIAARAGVELRVVGRMDPTDREGPRGSAAPFRDAAHVAVLGELSGFEQDRFLGGARALLCPADRPEPSGLAMIEALACGTPVVAWRAGPAEEIVTDGVTGFLVEDVDQAVAAVARLPEIDRHACRRAFEERFDARRMAREYLALYDRLRGPRLPYELGPVDVAATPSPALGGVEPLIRWETGPLMPGPPRAGDGES